MMIMMMIMTMNKKIKKREVYIIQNSKNMYLFKKCHHNYDKVDARGYQYCTICGKAELIGVSPCNHVWKTNSVLSSENIYTRNTSYYIYIQQCTKCGTLQQFKTL